MFTCVCVDMFIPVFSYEMGRSPLTRGISPSCHLMIGPSSHYHVSSANQSGAATSDTATMIAAMMSLISYNNVLIRLFTPHLIILLLSSDGYYYYKHLDHTDNLQCVPIFFKLAIVQGNLSSNSSYSNNKCSFQPNILEVKAAQWQSNETICCWASVRLLLRDKNLQITLIPFFLFYPYNNIKIIYFQPR